MENSDLKKRAIIASKNAISTQNNYNSIIYLVKQNKAFNINKSKNKGEESLAKEDLKFFSTALTPFSSFASKFKEIENVLFLK